MPSKPGVEWLVIIINKRRRICLYVRGGSVVQREETLLYKLPKLVRNQENAATRRVQGLEQKVRRNCSQRLREKSC